jgi:hypothetical protein
MLCDKLACIFDQIFHEANLIKKYGTATAFQKLLPFFIYLRVIKETEDVITTKN